eukprot:TRINITY_DN2285_c0_g1_i10.p2 TRINITY_DN2285_c0_g1~~TRINITY_DN2285_c0_g1_i10.p2  ORF type:complete len:366 (+),score=63.40 TRINITY_DN2285_c0_g1_i10:1282-2379(+)
MIHSDPNYSSPLTSPVPTPPASPILGDLLGSRCDCTGSSDLTAATPPMKRQRTQLANELSIHEGENTDGLVRVLSDADPNLAQLLGTQVPIPTSARTSLTVAFDVDNVAQNCAKLHLSVATADDAGSVAGAADITGIDAAAHHLSVGRGEVAGDDSSRVAALQRLFTKEQFAQLLILGQFNLGFILCRHNDDVFIVDQHAAHEIYNFEQLERDTVIHSQPLLAPLALQLTAEDELLVGERLAVFQKNGFLLHVDEAKAVGARVAVRALPYSKTTTFSVEDAYELVALLRAAEGSERVIQTLRLSRVRAMLASRACRKSIMVGTPLTHAQMQKVVSGLGALQKPWNCPHGRPTMRHLFSVAALHTV